MSAESLLKLVGTLTVERPILCFDVEATGKDPAKDRIVELAVAKWQPGSPITTYEQRFHADVPMSPEASEKTGITDEDLFLCPEFAQHAQNIFDLVNGADLIGFNLRNFDIPILWEELYRASISWSLDGVQVIDAGNIYKKKCPRTLSDAVREFCGRDHEGAHGSAADVTGTVDVLIGQLARYEDLAEMDVAALAAYSTMEDQRRADLAGKLLWDNDGNMVYNIGQKTKGVRVKDDLGFGHWMLRKDFPANTKVVLERELLRIQRGLRSGCPPTQCTHAGVASRDECPYCNGPAARGEATLF